MEPLHAPPAPFPGCSDHMNVSKCELAEQKKARDNWMTKSIRKEEAAFACAIVDKNRQITIGKLQADFVLTASRSERFGRTWENERRHGGDDSLFCCP